MRSRTIVLVVAILLVAGFAALNWTEIVRPAPLLIGPATVSDAPLGLILLALLGITLVAFLISSAAQRTQSLIDYRHHQKDLEAQRELADKAEASRFVDLRQHLDRHLKEMRERDAIVAAEVDKAMLQSRREVQEHMEKMDRMLTARLDELEDRLGGRFVPAVGRDTVALERTAADARAAQLREEERLRDEQLREQRELRREERAVAADKPAEPGWRKWF